MMYLLIIWNSVLTVGLVIVGVSLLHQKKINKREKGRVDLIAGTMGDSLVPLAVQTSDNVTELSNWGVKINASITKQDDTIKILRSQVNGEFK